jgi:hypothetical protein
MEDNMSEAEKGPRIIDTKLPLSWLIGTAGTIVISLTIMYANVNRLIVEVNELQSTMKTWSAQNSQISREVAVLQWRVENFEADKRRAETAQPRPK